MHHAYCKERDLHIRAIWHTLGFLSYEAVQINAMSTISDGIMLPHAQGPRPTLNVHAKDIILTDALG